jgi:uncharacterized protein
MIDALDEHVPTDESPRITGAAPTRTCIVTRKATHPDNLIRFALSNDDDVTPDLARKLPGRGAWVINDSSVLALAVKKNAFQRAFKKPVKTAGLLELVETLMHFRVLAGLSLAMKAGLGSFGFDNVQKSIAKGQTKVLIAANTASPDQLSKLIAGTGLILSEISQIENERLQFLTGSVKKVPETLLWVRTLSSDELDKATGRSGLMYIALKRGEGLTPFLDRMTDLARFRGNITENK